MNNLSIRLNHYIIIKDTKFNLNQYAQLQSQKTTTTNLPFYIF